MTLSRQVALTRLMIGLCLCLVTAGYATAKMPSDFHGLWLSDSVQECPAGSKVDFMNLAAGGFGLYIDATNYVTTESECSFIGAPKRSCCDSDTSKTISSGFQCGNSKGKVMFHTEVDSGKQILIEAFENASSGPNITVYRKQCTVTK